MAGVRLAGGENPMIFDNGMARPGPLPSAMQQGMARPTPWNENHTSGFVSDQVYTQQYVVRPNVSGWEKHLPVGVNMFVPKLDQRSGDFLDDTTPRSVLPLHAVNMMLARFYKNAQVTVQQINTGRLPGHPLKPYLDGVQEALWSGYYDTTNPETRRGDDFVNFHYLTAVGIMDRINYVGVQTTESVRAGSVSYASGTESVRAGSVSYASGDINAVSVHQGPCDMLNIFKDSWSGAECFFILKRIRVINPENERKEWGPFAFVPYALPPGFPTIPKDVLGYESVSGTYEDGYVIRVGTMLDIQGAVTSNDAFLQAWGIQQFSETKSKEEALAQVKNMPWCRFLRLPTYGQQWVV